MIATASISFNSKRKAAAGFSLVELAIAIFIMALLIGGLMVPLQSQVEGRKIDETQRTLDQAREALLGFVAANGYFPCPADTANGAEAAGFAHNTATTCPASVTGTNVYAGFFPATALGFTPVDSNGYALDAWGLQQNRIRYAVANPATAINGVTQTFTKTNGMKTATMGSIVAAPATNFLNVCRTGANATCAATDMLSTNTIAVIWSLGPNAPTTATSPHEDKNSRAALTSYTRLYVQAERASTGTAIFDDQLTWISPPTLFNRMIAAGTLP